LCCKETSLCRPRNLYEQKDFSAYSNVLVFLLNVRDHVCIGPRWEDNTLMNIGGMRCEALYWIQLAQNRIQLRVCQLFTNSLRYGISQ
jgi:hypothetical protein